MFDQEAYQHQYYLDNKDKISEKSKRHYLKNRETTKEHRMSTLKSWRLANPEKVRQQGLRHNARAKLSALTYYSGGPPRCAHCGISDIDVLCLDHINGGGYKQRKELNCGAGTAFYQWLKGQGYPEGYQVLCWNCNIKKRIQEGC